MFKKIVFIACIVIGIECIVAFSIHSSESNIPSMDVESETITDTSLSTSILSFSLNHPGFEMQVAKTQMNDDIQINTNLNSTQAIHAIDIAKKCVEGLPSDYFSLIHQDKITLYLTSSLFYKNVPVSGLNCATNDTTTGILIAGITPESFDLEGTYYHEFFHSIYRSSSFGKEWEERYNTFNQEYVSAYAKSDIAEDAAETFASLFRSSYSDTALDKKQMIASWLQENSTDTSFIESISSYLP